MGIRAIERSGKGKQVDKPGDRSATIRWIYSDWPTSGVSAFQADENMLNVSHGSNAEWQLLLPCPKAERSISARSKIGNHLRSGWKATVR
jgi:hypothetical protein